jgi:phosphinothricin acetyltransferase
MSDSASDVLIRPFAPADVPALTRIYAHYVTDTVITFETVPPGEAEMAARFAAVADRGHPLLVAARGAPPHRYAEPTTNPPREGRGHTPIGYAYASTYRPREAYRFTCEDSIYLAPDAVGRGLGSRLLARLLAEARAAGLRQMLAVITAERANSIRLHEKHGFRLAGRYAALGYKFDRWVVMVHMPRAL